MSLGEQKAHVTKVCDLKDVEADEEKGTLPLLKIIKFFILHLQYF